jgi:methylglyoxal synthase
MSWGISVSMARPHCEVWNADELILVHVYSCWRTPTGARSAARCGTRAGKEERIVGYGEIAMGRRKRIALVAHDNKKEELLDWAHYNRDVLARHQMYATGTTGRLLEKELGFEITKARSGPLGGDMQIGARIADGDIDLLVFFWDPLTAQPHDPDVKALLRIAVVWNIPLACDRASADFIISSPLMSEEYRRRLSDTEDYATQRLQ